MSKNYQQGLPFAQPNPYQYGGGFTPSGNWYPVNPNPYVQQPQQPIQQTQAPQPQQNNGGVQFGFVSGVDDAKMQMQLCANGVFFDDDANILYLKKTDEQGKTLVQPFSTKPIEMPKSVTTVDTANFATKDDITAINNKLDDLVKQAMAMFSQPKPQKVESSANNGQMKPKE